MSGYIGPIPVPQGIQNKETFTATAGQTTFNTNGYTDGAFINVYLNGVRLINGTDYTATNGSDIVLTQAASVSDVLDFETFNSFSLASQQFENITTKNPTHEDTDGGRESALSFQGEQSGGEISTLAQIQASHDGTADDQKGDLIFKTNDGSDNNAPTEAMRIDSEQNLGLGTNSPDVRLHVTDSQEQLTISEGGSKGATFDYRSSTGNLNIATNGVDARANPQMILDLNGRVMIGTTTEGHGQADDLTIGGSGHRGMTIRSDDSNETAIFFSDATSGTGEYIGALNYTHSDNSMKFFVNVTERMRILSTGRVHIGQNLSSNVFGDLSSAGNTLSIGLGATFGDNAQIYNTGGFSGDYDLVIFRNANGIVGRININGSTTTYATSSDYRMKENVAPISDGITRLKQLKPSRFNFIADADKKVDGFLAHEAQTVVPEAVTGTKDELEVWKEHEELPDGVSVGDNKLDDDGKTIPVMQGIDQSKIVPLLTAALQEAITKIETLETKVAALEGE